MDDKIRFLVPVAFSPQTEVITEQACRLAERYKAELIMLYVFDSSRTKGFFLKPEDESVIKKNAESQFNEFLDKKRALFGIKIKGVFVEGRVYEMIAGVATSLSVKLIIMGTNGAVGIKSQFIGSNTMRVIKQSPCPVITIKGNKHRKGCDNIVLPLDLTRETTQKVEQAINFAKMFGSTIQVVSILNTTDEDVIGRLTRQMADVEDEISRHGINCVAAIVKTVKGEDTLPSAIIAYSKKVKADVIMIMTQKETNPTEFFIGSRAQTVINTSEIPIMSLVPKSVKPLEIL